MKFDIANTVLFGTGAVLIYAAIKNVTPKDVVSSALKGKTAKPLTVLPGAPAQAPPLANQNAPLGNAGYTSPYNPGYQVTSV